MSDLFKNSHKRFLLFAEPENQFIPRYKKDHLPRMIGSAHDVKGAIEMAQKYKVKKPVVYDRIYGMIVDLKLYPI